MKYPSKQSPSKSNNLFLKKHLNMDSLETRIEYKNQYSGQSTFSPLQTCLSLKSSNRISSKPPSSIGEFSDSFIVTQKFCIMREIVVQLLKQHPVDNFQVFQGLKYLLALLENITKPRYKGSSKYQTGTFFSDKNEGKYLIDESTKVNSTLTKLIQISKSRQVKDSLNAIKHLQEKVLKDIDSQKYSSSPRYSYNSQKEGRISEYWKDETPQIIILKEEKVKLMQQLNREIHNSNKKSEQINILQSKLNKLLKGAQCEPSRLQRCLSSNFISSTSENSQKDHLISRLVKQNQDLKKQIIQLKQFSMSESFISEAFNFRDKQISTEKQHYQKIIKELRAQINELESKLNNNIHKRSYPETHRTNQYSSEEFNIREYEQENRELHSKIEYFKDSCKSLMQEVSILKNQIHLLKKSSSFVRERTSCQSPDYRKMKQTHREA